MRADCVVISIGWVLFLIYKHKVLNSLHVDRARIGRAAQDSFVADLYLPDGGHEVQDGNHNRQVLRETEHSSSSVS